jgi:hypothetical protein
MTEEQIYKHLGTVPHCDAMVLHEPLKCEFCDMHPDWQALRILWGVNFTGEHNLNKTTCPSELRRPVETINLWPGNRPHRKEQHG